MVGGVGRGRVEKTDGSLREEGMVLGRGGVDEGGGRRFRGCDGWWKRSNQGNGRSRGMVTGWRKKRCLLCRVVVEGGPRMDKLESEVKGVVIGTYREDGVEEGGDGGSSGQKEGRLRVEGTGRKGIL